MIDFLMIIGFLVLFIGLPASIIVTIVFFIKKKKVLIPAICIPITFWVGIIAIGVGGYLYGETDEYQQQLAEQTVKEQTEKEETEEKEVEEEKAEKEKAAQEQAEREKAEKEQAAKKKAEKEKAEEEKAKKFEYADTNIKYLRSEIDYNSIDDKCLYVYFEFTNNSDENESFNYLVTCKAFQNGVELETNYIYDCDEERNGTKEIQPGTTITVAEVFKLGDSTENVSLEVTPFSIWSDRKLFEYEIKLSE